MQDQPAQEPQTSAWPSISGPVVPLSPSPNGEPEGARSAAPLDHATEGAKPQPNRHDALLFLKLATLLLGLAGTCLFFFGLVLGTAGVTVAPIAGSQDPSGLVCGSAFSPATEGDTQPPDSVLNRRGEWLCRAEIGTTGNIAGILIALGLAGIIGAVVTGVAAGDAIKGTGRKDRQMRSVNQASSVSQDFVSLRFLTVRGQHLRTTTVGNQKLVSVKDLAALCPLSENEIGNRMITRTLSFRSDVGLRSGSFAEIGSLNALTGVIPPDLYAELAAILQQ